MTKSLPPLTWLRSFEAAARHLSFTAAAEEMGMTQSAVSQQIKALEQRLRAPLFIRQARGLTLTDDGRRLVAEIGAPLEALAQATATFDVGPAESLLTIATSVSVAQWVIAPRLPEFTQRHPAIRLRILSAIWPDDFHTARADVELRFGPAKQVGKDAEPLLPNRLVAVKSPALQGTIDTLPLIEAVGTSSGWKSWAEKTGTRSRAPTLYADNYGMALQLAAHGNGVALVDEWLAGYAIASGALERAHPAFIDSREGYFLFARQSSPAAMLFQSWLLGEA